MERQGVRVEVFEKDGVYGSIIHNDKYEADSLGETIHWLSSVLAEIPAEHRASARFEVESTSEYDSDRAVVRIYYTRPETDDELAARQANEAAYRRRREDEERRAFERLKAKFEGHNQGTQP